MNVQLFLVAVLEVDKAQKSYIKINSLKLKLTRVGGHPLHINSKESDY